LASQVEARIWAGFLGAMQHDLTRSSYLERYLAAHVAAGGLWSELDGKVLNLIDPRTVRAEAFRLAYGREVLPPLVLATMVAASDLAAASQTQRGLVRVLAAHRLGAAADTIPAHPALRWSRLNLVTPHITLTGHTSMVVAVAFGRLPDGRTVLAAGSNDATVRFWAIGGGEFVTDLGGYLLRPSSCWAVAVSSDAVFVGCSDGLVALEFPASGDVQEEGNR
jgi:hypothetical protein